MFERDVRLTYRFLGHSNQTEIRMIDPKKILKARSVFVRSEDEFVDVCRENEGKYNLYVGINERDGRGVRADNIIRLNAIIIDVDSKHPSKLPSTAKETAEAFEVAEQIYEKLKACGKDVYMAMSGNGWQLWMKMDQKITDENRYRMEHVLKEFHRAIKEEFEDDSCIVDIIGDLPRVIKIIGTTAIKPERSTDRPFRVAFWRIPPYEPKTHVEWGIVLNEIAMKLEKNVIPRNLEFDSEEIDDELFSEYYNRLGDYGKSLMEGEWEKKGYKSRSEAEMALVGMFANRKVPIEHVSSLMNRSKIGKWVDAKSGYKNMTIRKVYNEQKEFELD